MSVVWLIVAFAGGVVVGVVGIVVWAARSYRRRH